MSADQSQHYLPQSYQRGWLGPQGHPYVYRWVYDKLVCEPKATRSTGARDGLYFVPMAPPAKQNFMEDVFWRRIDQWGADGLALLRSADPKAASKINRQRLAIFIMSFLFRNPTMVGQFNAWARNVVLNGPLQSDYDKLRRAHEPATFEEFREALHQPGMTELAANALCTQVTNNQTCGQLLAMEWQVVTVPPTSDPVLTSDVPVIVYRGLKHEDGCLVFPLSTNEFFVAYNLGTVDMKKEISEAVATGEFVRGINKYVVEHRIEYVYGVDNSLRDFVAKHWAVSEAPFLPDFSSFQDMPPETPSR